MNCLISCKAFNCDALRSDSNMMIFFFCKIIAADGNVQQLFRIWANPSSNKLQSEKSYKSYKAKILSKPCQSRICSKGKTFLFLSVIFDGRGFAADANVDYRKDFSETERRLTAGSGI